MKHYDISERNPQARQVKATKSIPYAGETVVREVDAHVCPCCGADRDTAEPVANRQDGYTWTTLYRCACGQKYEVSN
jgi:DNA-directed RNA polymerase subunit M/transcription elongation factor TFIIS